MEIFDTLFRIVHVATAIVLVGGSVFVLVAFLPAIHSMTPEVREQISAAINGRWKRFVHIGVLLFLVSGFYNYFRAIPLHKGDGLYHGLLGTKMLLALIVFFFASALVGRSPKLQAIRDQRRKWLSVVVVLAAIIVSISGYLKIRGIPESTGSPVQPTQVAFPANDAPA